MKNIHCTDKRQHLLKRVLAVIMIVLFTFTTLSMAASAVVFRILFGRSERSAASLELTVSSIDQNRYPCQEVHFSSGENELCGYLWYKEKDKGLIILIAGAEGGAESHLAEMMYFADHGWAVLSYDGTGTRSSEGDGVRGLSQAKCDALAAVEYANGLPGLTGLPVILYGHSVGGYAAAAALDSGSRIDGVISISGFNSPVETMHHFAKERTGILADVQYPFLCLQNLMTFGDDANTEAADAINSSDVPVMIIHGTQDQQIPDDLSIYSHREEITNPSAVFLQVSQDGRNGHSNAWLSQDAAIYMDACQMQLEELSSRHGGQIPQAELDSFYESIDWQRLYQLDPGFMSQVLNFCNQAA